MTPSRKPTLRMDAWGIVGRGVSLDINAIFAGG
jgi:hypothetical protein